MDQSVINRRAIEHRVKTIAREIDNSSDVLEKLHLVQERITLSAVLDVLQPA